MEPSVFTPAARESLARLREVIAEKYKRGYLQEHDSDVMRLEYYGRRYNLTFDLDTTPST